MKRNTDNAIRTPQVEQEGFAPSAESLVREALSAAEKAPTLATELAEESKASVPEVEPLTLAEPPEQSKSDLPETAAPLELVSDNSPGKAKAPAQSLVFELLDWAKYFLVALILGLFLMGYVIQRNEVVGVSMEPNLMNRDRLWVEKISRLWNGYQRGEIVTIHGAGLADGTLREDDLVKRVIALPGEHLRIEGGDVYLNGQKFTESYLPEGRKTRMPNDAVYELVLGEGQYFVMGDNRDSSRDSRYFGPVDEEAIMGVVWFRSWPLDRLGLVN